MGMMYMHDVQIELVRLMDKSRTDEGRETIRRMIDEISELLDNARKCKVFDTLVNIRNIGLHTGIYMILESIAPYYPKYEKIVELTRDLLRDVMNILESKCGCRER
jgi:S-ribosylhomocysteine lyase LuxS involved in autoinducer biosynthesis